MLECYGGIEKREHSKKLAVISQKNDLKIWKDSKSYGQRWIVCQNRIFLYKAKVWRVGLFG